VEDQDVREWIGKLVDEEHELFRQVAQGGASRAKRERRRELEEYLDQCWDFCVSGERNESQGSILKPPAFATWTWLSATNSEDELESAGGNCRNGPCLWESMPYELLAIPTGLT
jgi:hypothetical protein